MQVPFDDSSCNINSQFLNNECSNRKYIRYANNKYSNGCPAIMNDSRVFTDYETSKTRNKKELDQLIQNKVITYNNKWIMPNHKQQRLYLQSNEHNIRNQSNNCFNNKLKCNYNPCKIDIIDKIPNAFKYQTKYKK